MKRALIIISSLLFCLGYSFNSFADKEDADWFRNDDGLYYINSDGSKPHSTWKKIDGEWYYFHSEGYIYNENWDGESYISSSGEVLKYAVNPDGHRVEVGEKGYVDEAYAREHYYNLYEPIIDLYAYAWEHYTEDKADSEYITTNIWDEINGKGIYLEYCIEDIDNNGTYELGIREVDEEYSTEDIIAMFELQNGKIVMVSYFDSWGYIAQGEWPEFTGFYHEIYNGAPRMVSSFDASSLAYKWNDVFSSSSNVKTVDYMRAESLDYDSIMSRIDAIK